MEPVSCDEESDCLAKIPNKARRKGRVLTLKLDNGKSRTVADSKNCATDEENSVNFTLRSYRPAQNVYVVNWSGWESRGVTLVSTKTRISFPDLYGLS